jgi:hypothetical protein
MKKWTVGWSRCLIAAGAIGGLGAPALADLWSWTYTPGTPGLPAANNAGGTLASLNTTFDTSTNRLTWNVRYSNQVTKGFWLVLSAGPNPKNKPGEYAILYFDANDLNAPRLTAYGYNGQNAANSWQDGDPVAPGNQQGDLILSSLRAGWIESVSAADVGGGREFAFTIHATDIIGHTPLYPDPIDPWQGTGYASRIGMWFHWTPTFNATYDPAGALTALSLGQQGYLDGGNLVTTRIPAPGAACAAVIGGLVLARRRRR